VSARARDRLAGIGGIVAMLAGLTLCVLAIVG
jgi:hypothetical protein